MVIQRSSSAQTARLIDDLIGADPVRREAAVARLAIVGERAVERLLAALADASPDATVDILRTLELIGSPRVVAAALARLDAPSDAVAIAAVGALRAHLRASDDDVAAQTLDGLTRLALAKGRSDPPRLAALEALGELGGHEGGVDRIATDRVATDRIGTGRIGMGQIRTGQIRTGQIGTGRAGTDTLGADRLGVDRSTRDKARAGSTGGDKTAAGRTGHGEAASDQAGMMAASRKRAGTVGSETLQLIRDQLKHDRSPRVRRMAGWTEAQPPANAATQLEAAARGSLPDDAAAVRALIAEAGGTVALSVLHDLVLTLRTKERAVSEAANAATGSDRAGKTGAPPSAAPPAAASPAAASPAAASPAAASPAAASPAGAASAGAASAGAGAAGPRAAGAARAGAARAGAGGAAGAGVAGAGAAGAADAGGAGAGGAGAAGAGAAGAGGAGGTAAGGGAGADASRHSGVGAVSGTGTSAGAGSGATRSDSATTGARSRSGGAGDAAAAGGAAVLDWMATRAAAHQALAERHSRLAVFDLRDTFEQASARLPLGFVAALEQVGDASCLPALAAAWQQVDDGWMRDRLAAAFQTIMTRESLTRRHAVVRRALERVPAVAETLAKTGRPPAR